MTREEILAMQPGREMDLLVAEKVMGWELGEDFIELSGGLSRGGKWFNPSTDIAAAWEVFEEALKGASTGYITDAIEGFACGLVDKPFFDDDPCEVYDAVCSTAPEAICKAALLACLEVMDK